jgi:hypothetical protein
LIRDVWIGGCKGATVNKELGVFGDEARGVNSSFRFLLIVVFVGFVVVEDDV